MTRSWTPLLTWFGLTIAASLMLYHTSDRVNALDHQLRGLNGQIEAEQQSLHILKAEWVYLANPARVEAAVSRHLDLKPTPTKRVLALSDIGSLLPLHAGVEPPVALQSADAAPAPAQHVEAATPPSQSTRHKIRLIASSRAGHVNDHMIMQHGAVVEASTNGIGGLIGTLGIRP